MIRSKYFLALICMLVLAACDKAYHEADNTILCDPITGTAFHVKRGAGETSFVQRSPKYDLLCRSKVLTNDRN